MTIVEFITQPWAWYITGPLIGMVLFLNLYLGKTFGASSSFEGFCDIGGAGKIAPYFKGSFRDKSWQMTFVIGGLLGGYIAGHWLKNPRPLVLSAATVADLNTLGIPFDGNFLPASIFSWNSLLTVQGFVVMVVGGFLVGFGTRLAGGCTSGHAISGISNFQLLSLIATVGFFIGGLVATHFLFPILFN